MAVAAVLLVLGLSQGDGAMTPPLRSLLVSGYAGEPVPGGPRKPLTPMQVSVAEGALMVELTWLDEGVLIHGAAPGVDTLADALASVHGMAGAILPMPAPWERLGKPAGMRRNEWMLDVLCRLRGCGYECRVLCLPGPKSRGTWQMKRMAEGAHFDVTVKELP
jgi:hypothetical protein